MKTIIAIIIILASATLIISIINLSIRIQNNSIYQDAYSKGFNQALVYVQSSPTFSCVIKN